MVNAPSQDNEIVLAIRGDGDFTKAIQNLTAPTKVLVDGGYGMFETVLQDQQPDHLLMITGGIGVTPLLSVMVAHPEIPTTVFHGATTEAALIYGDRFEKWSQEREQFKVHRKIGPFEEKEILSSLPNDLTGLTVLVSGPPAMARYWMKNLQKNGVPKGQIFYEEFGW